jgi:hypothetical protein
MRVSHAFIAAMIVALSGCSRPNYPQPSANVNETVTVSGSSETIHGLEADLRKLIQARGSDADVGIGLNEMGGPLSRTVQADSAILNAAFEDARRKARALADAVHAKLGEPIAVDEVNAADAAPRYGGASAGLKGNVSSVMLNRDMPEIVRVTFALTPNGRGPTSVTVYGLQGPALPAALAPATQLSVNISASGDDALKTIASWESQVRDAAHRNGARDADIRVGNVNANFPRRNH